MINKKAENHELVLSETEKADMQRGRRLLEESRDSSAVDEIRKLLTDYGFVTDANAENQAEAEYERHRAYQSYQNIRMLLENYRRFVKTIEVYKDELASRVDHEDMGGHGNIGSPESEGFFTRLACTLDLLEGYDERKMARRYESRIRSCQYIEVSVQALELGLRLYEGVNPSLCKLLHVVYIDGPARPSIQEVIEKLNITGSSTYYRQLETARKQLSQIVFGHSLNRDELFQILVALRQVSEENAVF